MNDNVINLPPRAKPASRIYASREIIRIGRSQAVTVVANTAGEVSVPLVELRCPFGEYLNLTVKQADELAAALTRAAERARE